MTYAYIRQVPDFPSLISQKQDILTFSLQKEISINKEVVEYASKNLILDEREEFDQFLQSMKEGNIIIVSDLMVLSNRAEELIKVITCVLSHEVDLHIVNSNLLINKHTKMENIFPLLNKLRTEAKDKNMKIGRPKGSKSTSKFDVYQGEVINMLGEGKTVSAIARELEVSRSSLKDYIESRGIKELVNSAWQQVQTISHTIDLNNVVLICPFEEAQRLKDMQKGL